MHVVLKGFVLCKIAYIFKVACLPDLFMNLKSFVFNIFLCFVLFIKSILVLRKLTYETVSYLDDIAQEGQGFIYASSRID